MRKKEDVGKVQLNINISPSLRDSLKKEARKEGKTLTDFIIENLSNIERESAKSSSDIVKIEDRIANLEFHMGLNYSIKPFIDSEAKNITAFDKAVFFGFANHHKLDIVETWNSLSPYVSFLSEKEQLRFKEVLGGFSYWTSDELNIFTNNGSKPDCPFLNAFEEWTNIKLPSLEEIRSKGMAMSWPFNNDSI